MSTNKIVRSDAEWRKILTPEQYHALREKGTEIPGTGVYYKTKDPGMYICGACGAELFSSETKFDSHSGWPSFHAPAAEGVVTAKPDESFGMRRAEIVCSRCGGHLGHVFDIGPGPAGKHFCVNSASLKFKKKI